MARGLPLGISAGRSFLFRLRLDFFVLFPHGLQDRGLLLKLSDTFHAITKSARTAVNQAVLNAYDLKLQQVQQTDIEVENTPDEEMPEPEDEPEPELSM